MNYRVMIVDDEPGIAEGIKYMINRYMPQCQVETLAYGGQDGYEKALSIQPDIILSDIRMPEVDGLEMIQRIQDEGIHSRFIILSGYSEFEYAQKAIRLGVEGYITKPVEKEELCGILGKVCNVKEQERSSELANEGIKTAVREYVIKDILEGKLEKYEDIRARLAEIKFRMDYKAYLCVAFEMDAAISGERDVFCQEIKLLMGRYMDFCQDWEVIAYTGNVAAAILCLGQEAEKETVNKQIRRLRQTLAERINGTVCCGIGLWYHQAEKIGESYREARCALNYKLLQGVNSCIEYEQIRTIESEVEWISKEDIDKLEQAIDQLDEFACRQALENIFNKLERDRQLSIDQLQLLSLNLLLTGIRKIPFIQFQLNEYLGKNIFALESIARFRTIEQLKNWIFNTLKSMNELMLKDTIPDRKDIVEEAKEYMNKNLSRDINLNTISEKFFVNPSYFSQLFKKKTGKTYLNYLTELRVLRAKQLLWNTDLKVAEICTLVGYSDANYFNKVFEKNEGMKPSEYRKQRSNL